MTGANRTMLTACAAYIVAYVLAYVLIGGADNAYDAATSVSPIAMHDAERMLSAAFDLAVVPGLLSLWAYDARTWAGGFAVGSLTAFAAGGFHVLAHMGTWLLPAVAVGFAGGLALFALTGKKPAQCALFAVELTLAVLQVAFLVVYC